MMRYRNRIQMRAVCTEMTGLYVNVCTPEVYTQITSLYVNFCARQVYTKMTGLYVGVCTREVNTQMTCLCVNVCAREAYIQITGLYVDVCSREAQLLELNRAKKPDCVTFDIFYISPSVVITLQENYYLVILHLQHVGIAKLLVAYFNSLQID